MLGKGSNAIEPENPAEGKWSQLAGHLPNRAKSARDVSLRQALCSTPGAVQANSTLLDRLLDGPIITAMHINEAINTECSW